MYVQDSIFLTFVKNVTVKATVSTCRKVEISNPLVVIEICDLLKLVSAIFYQIFIFSPNDSLSKTTKNVFYFI